MTKLTPTRADTRINIIDAFRGFALAGIVISHMIEQYIAARPPLELVETFTPGVADQVVHGLVQMLITGKFFTLFSFLFGLSFFIQMDRASSKDVDFRGRFIWRLVLLLIIGFGHSLFYRGDILTIYASLGLLLVLFYKVSNKLILVLAAILLAGAGRYLVFAIHGDSTMLQFGDSNPELPYNVAYFDALLNGSLWDVMVSNAYYGHILKLEFQLGYFGRWYQTFAFFLLGLWAGRMGLFQRLDEFHVKVKKTMWLAIGSLVLFGVMTGVLFGLAGAEGGDTNLNSWAAMFAFTSLDLFNFGLAIIYLCAFILIFRRPAGERILSRLAPYGRSALSNYFLQTLIGTFILYNWGLGLMGEVSNTDTLLIGLAIIALQVYISRWWLTHFRFGPLEWLWRSATYLKWQPIRN